MKIAVVYNRGTGNVINLFGMPNRREPRRVLWLSRRVRDGSQARLHEA